MASPRQGKVAADQGPLPTNLLQALRLVFNEYLSTETRCSLRQACRGLREAHDQAAQRFCLGRFPCQAEEQNPLPTSAEEVSATVRGALARGCRPNTAALNLRKECDSAAAGRLTLAFLDGLACADSVTQLIIGSKTPLTEAMVRAIACAIPKLTSVDVACCMSDAQQPAEDTNAAAAAGQLLLQLVGPQLKVISVSVYGGHWPACALKPLARCTSLTTLCLYLDWHSAEPEYGLAAESSMLRTLSSLNGLRYLKLHGGARPPPNAAARQERAASLESCLSSLTALTSLDIGLRCLQHARHPYSAGRGCHEEDLEEKLWLLWCEEMAAEAAQLLSAVAAESRALAAAVRCMPLLSELRTFAWLNAADLASLKALTYLRVGAIVLPTQGSNQQMAPVFNLPPALESLKVYEPMSVHVATSLRLSPAAALAGAADPISWVAPGLMEFDNRPYWTLGFQDSDLYDETRLTPNAVAAMDRAVMSLMGTFKVTWVPPQRCEERGLRVQVVGEHRHRRYVRPPAPAANVADYGAAAAVAAAAGVGDGTHCGSWLGATMAKLQPEALRLGGFVFSPRDVLGMASCLAGLKELDLQNCSYYLSSLPLLGGLAALEVLVLDSTDWEWPEETGARFRAGLVEGAFLGLTAPIGRRTGWCWLDERDDADALYESKTALPLPRLQRLVVHWNQADAEEWMRPGLAAATMELSKRRPLPAELIQLTY